MNKRFYDFDEIIDRAGTNSDKWECMHFLDPRADKGTLPLWVADMDFTCCDGIIEALKQRSDRRIFGYGCPSEKMYHVLSSWYSKRFDWNFESESVHYAPGIVPAIGYFIDILTKPGDGVIIFSPVYYPFAKTIKNHGRKVINSSLINDGNGYYVIDFDDLEKKVVDNKLLLFCSPHNPVGRVWTEMELRRLLDICIRHNVTIISDEIHNDIIRRNKKHFILETLAPQYKDYILTCVAPTKTFNLAGLQYSNIIIHNPEIRRAWHHHVSEICGISRPNVLSIAAVQAAYEYGEEWLEQLIDYLDGNMQFINQFLKERLPKSIYHIPEGTYLAWINLGAYDFNEDMYGLFITEGKILIENGFVFGDEGRDFVRINAACPRSILTECFLRMERVIKKANNTHL